MIDILKIASVLAVIIFLLKRKWNLGIVMALSSVFLALLYLLKPLDYLEALVRASTDMTTITLIIALTLIRVFENVMRKKGIMQEMMDSFRGMVMVFHLDLSISIGAVIIGLYAVLRYSLKNIIQSFREGFSWDIVVIILGVMTFKAVLTSSGAVTNISTFFHQKGFQYCLCFLYCPLFQVFLPGLQSDLSAAHFRL
ncbi:MAG TPA: hypothetical protein ENH52_02905 [Nitrospirae bacterium]|nr:hypothetical protein [Nitrospirota bacterium]